MFLDKNNSEKNFEPLSSLRRLHVSMIMSTFQRKYSLEYCHVNFMSKTSKSMQRLRLFFRHGVGGKIINTEQILFSSLFADLRIYSCPSDTG